MFKLNIQKLSGQMTKTLLVVKISNVELKLINRWNLYWSEQEKYFLGPDKYRSANEGFAFDEI